MQLKLLNYYYFFFKLTAPFQVGGQMVPIALPPVQHDLIDFTLCTVAGWGGTNITSTVSIMFKLNIYSSQLGSPKENVKSRN